ncbi:MAG: recombinase family protein [Nitrososphaerota archaeon]|nr:recombinase family protein [Nitrososphaerota archaeon]
MSDGQDVSGSRSRRRIVIGYARYSTEKQEEHSVSIDSQVNAMKRICEIKGWTYARTYKDEAVSGSTPPEERPGLCEILDELENSNRRWNTVMVMDDSRLARDQQIFWNLISRFREHGVRIVLAALPDLDSNRPEFRMVGGTLQAMSDYMREQIRWKTKLGMQELKRGGYALTAPPVGFRHEREGQHSRVVPDQDGEKVIAAVISNPRIRPVHVLELLDWDKAKYYRAWLITRNAKRYVENGNKWYAVGAEQADRYED